ncbi:DUF397 domain-containing protein [Actinoplanes aureus]|uniref:DUF397 domain-containing protein n=1 Tax=Actinoplanes aureus TaxID=2792083 RepID=A0A931CK54_9ACTN|nr:DUF397 domain-containing protein [Actinoplanes aureus]MBG0569167.1 DUF397 domain-containing protein [Actinoplanes aureus]
MNNASAPTWRKSSRCSTSTCVEVATVGGAMLIRNSSTPAAPPLRISRKDWEGFLDAIVAGNYRD